MSLISLLSGRMYACSEKRTTIWQQALCTSAVVLAINSFPTKLSDVWFHVSAEFTVVSSTVTIFPYSIKYGRMLCLCIILVLIIDINK